MQNKNKRLIKATIVDIVDGDIRSKDGFVQRVEYVYTPQRNIDNPIDTNERDLQSQLTAMTTLLSGIIAETNDRDADKVGLLLAKTMILLYSDTMSYCGVADAKLSDMVKLFLPSEKPKEMMGLPFKAFNSIEDLLGYFKDHAEDGHDCESCESKYDCPDSKSAAEGFNAEELTEEQLLLLRTSKATGGYNGKH